MPTERKRLERWLREYLRPKYPALEPQVLAAVNAYDAAPRSRPMTAEQLAPIIAAASSPRAPLFEIGIDLMQRLSKRREVCEAIERMAASKRANVRFSAIRCIARSTPRRFADNILRLGLADRSARVRGTAIDHIGRLHNARLIPDLEALLKRERDKRLRSAAKLHLELLRNGYLLEPEDDGGYSLTIPTADGGLAETHVDEAELKAKGVKRLVAQLRRESR